MRITIPNLRMPVCTSWWKEVHENIKYFGGGKIR